MDRSRRPGTRGKARFRPDPHDSGSQLYHHFVSTFACVSARMSPYSPTARASRACGGPILLVSVGRWCGRSGVCSCVVDPVSEKSVAKFARATQTKKRIAPLGHSGDSTYRREVVLCSAISRRCGAGTRARPSRCRRWTERDALGATAACRVESGGARLVDPRRGCRAPRLNAGTRSRVARGASSPASVKSRRTDAFARCRSLHGAAAGVVHDVDRDRVRDLLETVAMTVTLSASPSTRMLAPKMMLALVGLLLD